MYTLILTFCLSCPNSLPCMTEKQNAILKGEKEKERIKGDGQKDIFYLVVYISCYKFNL